MAANERANTAHRHRASHLLDVTVLMGGPSAERDISMMSGEAIANGLARCGHKVTRSDITPNDTSALDRKGIDVVFIALHGDFGESGEVQQLCEDRGLRYTGSGPQASKVSLDKAATKQILKRAGLTTPDWMIIEEFHAPQRVADWLTELPPPVVIKPVNGGSSVDIIIARDDLRRDAAVDMLLDRYGRAMLERYVLGRELTVSILGDEVLPVLEIVPDGDFYDKYAKYDDAAGTQYIFDHGLSDDLCRQIRDDALRAHEVLQCRDMSRADFILGADGVPQVLEINTIPGFTTHSLLPMAAARVGICFDELVDRIAQMAADRSLDKNQGICCEDAQES